MEKMGEDRREEELKYRTAIRCAKVATLLSSLKNATSNSTSNVPQLQDEGKIEMLKIALEKNKLKQLKDERKIEMLKIELVKNKLKLKKLKSWIGTSLLCYFLFLMFFPFVLDFILNWQLSTI